MPVGQFVFDQMSVDKMIFDQVACSLSRLLDNGSKALDLQIKLPGTNFIKLLAHSANLMNKLECLQHAGRYA
jgi:hypothetical protein